MTKKGLESRKKRRSEDMCRELEGDRERLSKGDEDRMERREGWRQREARRRESETVAECGEENL